MMFKRHSFLFLLLLSLVSPLRADDNISRWSKPSIPEVEYIHSRISFVAKTIGLEREFLIALVTVESNFDCNAVSPTGAMGCTQLKQITADEMDVDDVFDIDQNLLGGGKYLLKMYKYTGDISSAFAAYNVGLSRVRGKPYDDWPEAAKTYVAKINKQLRVHNLRRVVSAEIGGFLPKKQSEGDS